ncbi:MAG: O-antigen ligase family protein, partial [Novipirellula sp. JB048]
KAGLSSFGWLRARQRTLPLTTSAFLLAAWCVFSGTVQDRWWEANCLFGLILAMTYIATFRSIPRMLAPWSLDERLFACSLFLAFITIPCLFIRTYQQGRFVGIFGNATYSGAFLSVAVVYWTAIWLLRQRWQSVWLAMLISSTGLLLLTRTRASLAGAALGVAVVLAIGCLSRSWASRKAQLGTIGAVIATAVLFCALMMDMLPFDSRKILSFMRLDGGTHIVLASRSANWGTGASQFLQNGFAGEGFMSKYTHSGRKIFGINIPTYDWRTTDDPLNSLFLIEQQTGPIGAILYLIFLFALVKVALRTQSLARGMILGFVTVGLVFGFLSGNWLLSFGDSFDRFSFVFLAVILFAPE